MPQQESLGTLEFYLAVQADGASRRCAAKAR
jgi:hypothetical protein